jgi:hypothetical protein
MWHFGDRSQLQIHMRLGRVRGRRVRDNGPRVGPVLEQLTEFFYPGRELKRIYG